MNPNSRGHDVTSMPSINQAVVARRWSHDLDRDTDRQPASRRYPLFAPLDLKWPTRALKWLPRAADAMEVSRKQLRARTRSTQQLRRDSLNYSRVTTSTASAYSSVLPTAGSGASVDSKSEHAELEGAQVRTTSVSRNGWWAISHGKSRNGHSQSYPTQRCQRCWRSRRDSGRRSARSGPTHPRGPEANQPVRERSSSMQDMAK